MNLKQVYATGIESALRVCTRLAESKYVTSHGGNLALKLEEDLLLVTPTRLSKGEMRAEDLVFVDRAGRTVEGTRKPTGELPMYLGFFKERPDIRSVVHCHPPAVCAFAILTGTNWLARPFYPELSIEVGPVPRVRYAEPLTEQLAEAFAPLLRNYNAFLMENHGLVIMSAEDLDRTLQLVEILELSADSILRALAVGPLKELSLEALQGLENTRRTRNLPIMGAPHANESIVTLYERARTEG